MVDRARGRTYGKGGAAVLHAAKVAQQRDEDDEPRLPRRAQVQEGGGVLGGQGRAHGCHRRAGAPHERAAGGLGVLAVGGDGAAQAAHRPQRDFDKDAVGVDHGQERVDAGINKDHPHLLAKRSLSFCQDLCGCAHSYGAV